MQGFFQCPVDNLRAEPLIARWIRNHVPKWQEAVVVSKNAGGSKRVTSMADALKLNFGIITTDRRRERDHSDGGLEASTVYNGFDLTVNGATEPMSRNSSSDHDSSGSTRADDVESLSSEGPNGTARGPSSRQREGVTSPRRNLPPGSSPLSQATNVDGPDGTRMRLLRNQATPLALRSVSDEDDSELFTSERTREVVHGRLILGHVVDDDHPSPALSAMSSAVFSHQLGQPETPGIERQDPMTASFMSTVSSVHNDAMGGGGDDPVSDDEEASLNNPEIEHTITLVGDVRGRTVFLVDDMIDSSQAWIAAAETVRKRGGAGKVYCIATHGLFGDDCLEQLENCDCIDHIVVCNTFPIDLNRVRNSRKLVVLDLSSLLSEAIRRNHYGESISQLYQFYQD